VQQIKQTCTISAATATLSAIENKYGHSALTATLSAVNKTNMHN